ncbi:Hsp70 family protein [bacterium]|nr:Hsp70 family protein [candidate division CSSED10-310 bacterium]
MKLGIDLGMSSCAAAAIVNGVMKELVPKGGFVSVAARVHGKLEVGKRAWSRSREKGTVLVADLKRRLLTPQVMGVPTTDLIATILKETARTAGEVAGEDVERVVAGVPACFGMVHRRQYRKAFEKAGLPAPDIYCESAAAMIGLHRTGRSLLNGRYLLLDYGGGFAEMVIGTWSKNLFTTEACVCDESSGGRELDGVVLELIESAYRDAHGKSFPFDLKGLILQQPVLLERLLAVARAVKEGLTAAEQVVLEDELVEVRLEGLIIQREAFERAARSEIVRIRELCDRVLDDAGLGPEDITSVVLLGGSSRIPGLRQILEETLDPGAEGKLLEIGDTSAGLVVQGLAHLAAEPESAGIVEIHPHDIGLEKGGDRAELAPLILHGERREDLEVREAALDQRVDVTFSDSRNLTVVLVEAYRTVRGGINLLPLEDPFVIDLQTELGVRKEEYDGSINGEFLFETRRDLVYVDFKFAGAEVRSNRMSAGWETAQTLVEEEAVTRLRERIMALAFRWGTTRGGELIEMADRVLAPPVEVDAYLHLVDLLASHEGEVE